MDNKIEFSENDFQLIIDALSNYSIEIERPHGPNFFTEMLMVRGEEINPENIEAKIKRKMEEKKREAELEINNKKEELMLLVSKVIQLKRHLMQESAFNEVANHLGYKKNSDV